MEFRAVCLTELIVGEAVSNQHMVMNRLEEAGPLGSQER